MSILKNPFEHDKKLKIIRRNRIAENYNNYNFLKVYSSDIFIEKLKKQQKVFGSTLEIGSHTGDFTDKIIREKIVKKMISSDISLQMVKQVQNKYKISCDENKLPFKNKSFDGIFSCIYLSEMNNLRTILTKIRDLLKTKGFLLFSVFGNDTLKELKSAFVHAEIKFFGGVTPRVNNFFDIKTLGDLLLRLRFKNVVLERESIKVKYSSIYSLMRDIRGMGETNVLLGRKKSNDFNSFFLEVEKFLLNNNINDSTNLETTFEIITASCWEGSNN